MPNSYGFAGRRGLFAVNVIEEFPLYILLAETTREISGARLAVCVANAAGGYTHVVGVDHNSDIGCIEELLHFLSDLHSKPFLDLGPLGVVLHNAIDL